MYGTVIQIVIKPGMRAELLKFLRWDAEVAMNSEPGTLRFDVWEVAGVVYVYEAYKDIHAFEDHKKNAPYKKWKDTVRRTMDYKSEVMPFTESLASNVAE